MSAGMLLLDLTIWSKWHLRHKSSFSFFEFSSKSQLKRFGCIWTVPLSYLSPWVILLFMFYSLPLLSVFFRSSYLRETLTSCISRNTTLIKCKKLWNNLCLIYSDELKSKWENTIVKLEKNSSTSFKIITRNDSAR